MKDINNRYQKYITLLGRLILGGVLLVAGGLKAFVPAEAASAVAAYKILPTEIAHIVGYALPWLEIAIGLLLILGISIRMASIVAAGIMVLFIGAIISVWARGMLIDCGCFGGGGAIDPSKAAQVHRTYALEIARDTGLALVALYLYFFPYGLLSVEKSTTAFEEI
ncbi:MAG: DoxX family membrane protein [Streptomycetaceae bacterium]|nr:MAG: DoxX family membrane protein [Streptomycetaceae bacterium]